MVNKVFDSVTNSLSKFVLGWTIPSAVTIAIFTVFDFPAVAGLAPFKTLQQAAAIGNGLGLLAIFALVIVTLSVVFAYSQQPIYRFLEGYTIPRPLQDRLRRRQLRAWHRARLLSQRSFRPEVQRQLLFERQLMFPEDRDEVRPTRLGNALRAAETYGQRRFMLDSQSLWFELLATAPDAIRRDIEQSRAAMDLFVSSIMNFALLAVASLAITIGSPNWQTLIVGVSSLLVLPPAYGSAVRSVGDLRYAVQALVNTGRTPLAANLGFSLPQSIRAERRFWEQFCQFVAYGYGADDEHELWTFLDRFRLPPTSPPEPQTPSSAPTSSDPLPNASST